MKKTTNFNKNNSTVYSRFYVTDSIHEAIINNYIGEVYVEARTIVNDIKYVLDLPKLTRIHIIYYGKSNKRLRDMFGYPDE